MEFKPCGPEEAEGLSEYLHPIWHEVFDSLEADGPEGAEELFQTWTNPDAIRRSMQEGYVYGYISKDGITIGLYSYHILDDGRFYINKLYLESSYRGKGLGQEALGVFESIARAEGCSELFLNVLYFNERAIKAYKRFGFDDWYHSLEVVSGESTRNDLVMMKKLRKE